MPCSELQKLREEATTLKQRMIYQRRKARVTAAGTRTGRISGKSEMIPFLQRKLQRLSEKIEQHMASHQCQE